MTNESLVIYSMNKVEASPRSAPNKQGPALNNAYRGYRISWVHLNNAIVFPLAFANAAKRQSLWDIGHRRILYLSCPSIVYYHGAAGNHTFSCST